MKKFIPLLLFYLIWFNSFVAFSSVTTAKNTMSLRQQQDKKQVFKYDASVAKINSAVAEFVEDDRLTNKKGVVLKSGVKQALNDERSEPDIIYNVNVGNAGRYVMRTHAVTDKEGVELMKKAKTKFESLYIKIQIDDNNPTKRVVYVPWDRPNQLTGKFTFTGKEQKLKIWLPRGVRFDFLTLTPYTPPAVPDAAKNYKPTVMPQAGHPRLWVNKESLPQIKARLELKENKAEWEKVKKDALVPNNTKFVPNQEITFDAKLEKDLEKKAFYYLMTGDKKIGREAIDLAKGYVSNVEFGNLLDITREIGRAMYTTSLVYDWCYDLLSAEEKKIFVHHLLRLSDDMEIGWPPFLQSIVNGHGNEAQINRDLLSMSIAIFDEDPLPYQYCSYAVLENLVPMRKFEYQSPRHNQGVNYGSYRFQWDMHAAWLFYRMSGKEVFDPNIKNLPHFWIHMRTPDGQMLRDGDGFGSGKNYYWKGALTMLLSYAYSKDPIIKGEFVKQGSVPDQPVLFLLLNDPNIVANTSTSTISTTKDFGTILGSMVARTGWDTGENKDEVLAEIKGGGYHFGNHQHMDAGSVQLYYRGFQFGDLGVYKFYGTPYDVNFNKRSISHSMMLAVDPNEKYAPTESNDGGTKYNQRAPRTPREVTTNEWFKNGEVLSTDFGPSKLTPAYSYFSVDLASAYTKKLEKYKREFCFLNLNRKDIPAIIILTDNMQTTNPEFKKYWQINAHNEPELTKDGFILNNKRDDRVGKTHVKMLLPNEADRKTELLSGEDANSSFKFKYTAPPSSLPETKGHRIMVSPTKANKTDKFVSVMQVAEDGVTPLPIDFKETTVGYVVTVDDRVVSLSSDGFIAESFKIVVPSGKKKYNILLTGLKAGNWNVSNKSSKVNTNSVVEQGKNTIYLEGGKGEYTITPKL